MKKADFSKVEVQADFGRDPETVDLRHQIGNAIHQRTYDIGTDELARSIYFAEEGKGVEISDDQLKEVTPYLKEAFTCLAFKGIMACIK